MRNKNAALFQAEELVASDPERAFDLASMALADDCVVSRQMPSTRPPRSMGNDNAVTVKQLQDEALWTAFESLDDTLSKLERIGVHTDPSITSAYQHFQDAHKALLDGSRQLTQFIKQEGR